MFILFLIVLFAVWMVRNPLKNDGAMLQLVDNFSLYKPPKKIANTHWYHHTFNRPRKR